MRTIFQSTVLSIFLSVTGVAVYSEENENEYSDGLKSTLKGLGTSLSEIASTPVAGVFEIEAPDGNILYVTEDGKHVFTGELHSIEGTKTRNLTEERRSHARRELMAGLTMDETLNFAPTGNTEHIVYAFTDVDCGFCRTLHDNIEGYGAEGIEIRYLAYPRAGTKSETYKKMVSAWCATDPNDAITKLKEGEPIKRENCDNPIASHMELGRKLKISGTPTLILESGRVIPGYLPPDRLKQALANE
ncbi:MAG: DsbC family protein [Gammaproteobacteria bacterium]|nr:DsbC family protein [Gammaproteobacteria bacterium]